MAKKGEWFDEWKRQMDEAGYYVSEDDLARAAYDKDYADKTMENKAGWYRAYAAGDQEGMERYHSAQEENRSSYGYSGGAAGDEYIQTQKSSVPDYLSQATQTMEMANQMIGDQLRGIQSYGAYTDPYQQRMDAQLGKVLDYAPFSYDYRSDPAWQAYKKQYTREGQRASQDALAQAAMMTGGVPSSYAQTAAQQAGNYYAAQMADKIPELYKLAYDMYADQYNRELQGLNAVRGVSDMMYGRWGDQFNRDLSKLDAARGVYGDAYGVYTGERDYADAQEALAYNRAWNEEAREYERGEAERSRLWQEAAAMAEMGDWSGYEALGVTPDMARVLQMQLAQSGKTTAIGSGGGSGGSGSGKDIAARVGEHIGLDTDLGQEIAAVPNAIANYLEYWDKMDAETKYLGLIKSGVDISTAQRLCTSGSRWDAYAALSDVQSVDSVDVYAQMAAAGITSEAEAKRWLQANDYKYTEANDAAKTYMELYGKEEQGTWQDVLAKEIMDAKISTEEDARGFLRKNGINHYNILSKSMWEMERDLRPDAVTATTYKDYLEMMLFEALRGRR